VRTRTPHAVCAGCLCGASAVAARRAAALELAHVLLRGGLPPPCELWHAGVAQPHRLRAAQSGAPRLPHWPVVRVWQRHHVAVPEPRHVWARDITLLPRAPFVGHAALAEPKVPGQGLHEATHLWCLQLHAPALLPPAQK